MAFWSRKTAEPVQTQTILDFLNIGTVDRSKLYVDCMITSGTLNYYVYSNYIDNPLSTDTVQIWLRRINNIYQINIYNLT